MSKAKDKIRISFPSASAEAVAGSQVLIEFGKEESKRTILIECGLVQGESTLLKDYQANSKRFAFKPKELDYVFIGHLHADHGSLAPRLYKEGCEAPLILPSGSKNIYKEMLLDSANIMSRDSEYLIKKFNKDYYPIYEEEDVFNALSYVKEYERHEKIKLDDYVEFEFIPSGHIINACQLILWLKCGNNIRKIAITSDLGNRSLNQLYIDKFEPIENANLLIGETTYCNAKRSAKTKDRDKDLEKIKSAIDTTCNERKGNILIPAFSLQRFQSLLTHIYDLYHEDDSKCPEIYACSPLGCRMSDLFCTEIRDEQQKHQWKEVYYWNKIHFIKDFDGMQAALNKKQPAIYLAAPGMISIGYSLYLAKEFLPHSNNLIMFCGFMSANTLGWTIKNNKQKTITIDGKQIHARCQVMDLHSFSSHMQHDDLLWYYSSFNFDKICLVHGEMNDKIEFAKELKEEIARKNKTTHIVCVNKSTEINL